jgi:hypothetical protein
MISSDEDSSRVGKNKSSPIIGHPLLHSPRYERLVIVGETKYSS